MTYCFQFLLRHGLINFNGNKSDTHGSKVAICLFSLTIVIICYFAFRPMPPGGVEGMDKVNHMLAFSTLTFLAANFWGLNNILLIAERLSFFGAMIELIQSTSLVQRDCDFSDWVADTVSVVVVAIVLLLAKRLWSRLMQRRAQRV